MGRRVRFFVALTIVTAIVGSASARVDPPAIALGEPSITLAQSESFLRPRPARGGPPPALVADARLDLAGVRAFRTPGADRPFVRLDNPDRYGFRRVFLVKEVAPGWLEVYLPIRPNGATGWVRDGDVELRPTTHRVVIDLSSNRLTVFDGEEIVMREPVATGTGGTPTPTGLFYPAQLAEMPPGSAYGPLILGLSAYSEVLFSFGGGEGQVGIHGTNDPSSIGRDVSHGCIRMRNGAIRRLANIVPLGSPIRIRA